MQSPQQPAPESRLVPRPKTVATRLSAEELAEVEAAAKRSGKSLADWLRTVALEAARPVPDVNELILAELAATRYMILNFFLATTNAVEKKAPMVAQDVRNIREGADARKFETARKMLQEFRVAEDKSDMKTCGGR